jgi:hypothetical protein
VTADAPPLAHGPYRPPAVAVGDGAYCYFRRCWVVVTGFRRPLGWPEGRAPGGRGSASPVVNADLRRAVRTERVVALYH